jgi:hypothetical protein
VGEKVLILYMLCENKRKERVFLSLTASQLTSRHLTTNPATVEDEGCYGEANGELFCSFES